MSGIKVKCKKCGTERKMSVYIDEHDNLVFLADYSYICPCTYVDEFETKPQKEIHPEEA